MESIGEFISSHFSDFIIETFSVFLGFLSAFFMQIFFDAKKDKSTKKNIIKGIKRELKKITEILTSLDDNDFGIDLYDKPYWESIVSTGQVELLIREAYYEDLIKVYHKITTANSWEGLNSQACLINGRINPTIIKKVAKTRKDLCVEIKELLSKLPK